MHIHIANLGMAKDPVIKGIQEIGGINKIYLLTSSQYYKNGLDLKKIYEPLGISVEIRVVDAFDFQDIINEVTKIALDNKDKLPIYSANVTGGTNAMAGALSAGAYFIGAKICYVKHMNGPKDENGNEIRDANAPQDEFKWVEMPKASNWEGLSKKAQEIFNYIAYYCKIGEIVTNSKLADLLMEKKQNIGHHIGNLREEGLITEVALDGRTKSLLLTNQGMLVSARSLINFQPPSVDKK